MHNSVNILKGYLVTVIISFVLFLTGSVSGITDADVVRAAASPSSESKSNSTSSGFHSTAKSALLMEASTGQIIYEQDADTKRPPASVTKVMTLLLIFDSLKSGGLKLTDTVTVSEHAASMGGSQVFLESGETQTVETMIKCIAVASGNDACVAMAEHIAGSEEAFVEKMNQRARNLGMSNTHFMNCCGLDAEGHYTTARDIAIMSRELTVKYPDVFKYTNIWMENITHVTRTGSKEFGLTNTNKLIRQYEGATGLKTGSTSKAGFCLSGTATRNNISLIAVVMACDSSRDRISACSALLDYGFANCHIYQDNSMPELPVITVRNGKSDQLKCRYADSFTCVTIDQMDERKIKKKLSLSDHINAPVLKGQSLGNISYYYGDKYLGATDIISSESVEKAAYSDCIRKLAGALAN